MRAVKIEFKSLEKFVNEKSEYGISQEVVLGFASILTTEDGETRMAFDENSEDFIMFLPTYKINEICQMFAINNIEFITEDITEDVIAGSIPEKFSKYPEIFETYRLEYTTIDDILDKINKNGIESLDNVDKLILSK